MTGDPVETNGHAPSILRRGVIRDAARASDSYGLLLILVLIDYVTLSVGWTGRWALVVSTAFIGLTALLAFHTSHVRGRFLQVVQIAVAIAMVGAVVSAVIGGQRANGVVLAICALLILTSPIVILRRIFSKPDVTVESLLGAVCVYILLGLVFAYADFSVHLVGGNPFFAQSGQHGASDFVYFSFITQTTVGYGDLTPAVGLPRTMATLQALTGQIFLVVLVARLVSMMTPRTRSERSRRLREDDVSHGVDS
jgi:hypothetical protein